MKSVFITGGTGYMGTRLIPALIQRGHKVTAVVRPGSERKLPRGCTVVLGDALDGGSYAPHISGGDTFVHLVGVAHPSPAKALQFLSIDLQSAIEAMRVAKAAAVEHFIYLSVAQRSPGDESLRRCQNARGGDAGCLRNERFPPAPFLRSRAGPLLAIRAQTFLLVRGKISRNARRGSTAGSGNHLADDRKLVFAIENQPSGIRIYEVPEIKAQRPA